MTGSEVFTGVAIGVTFFGCLLILSARRNKGVVELEEVPGGWPPLSELKYVFAVITDIGDPKFGGNFYNAGDEIWREVPCEKCGGQVGRNFDDDRDEFLAVCHQPRCGHKQKAAYESYFPTMLDMFKEGAPAFMLPVFDIGEILILNNDEYGREPAGRGRKPSKWDVQYETFTDISEAVKRSREVISEDAERWAKEQVKEQEAKS